MNTDTPLKTAIGWARDLFALLDQDWQGNAPDQGMHRPGYSPEETRAHNDIVQAACAKLAIRAYRDLAGNTLLLTQDGDDSLSVRLTGSHLDAVQNGGRYDGPAGVITPLAALLLLQEQKRPLRQKIGVVIWRNEESPWFNQGMLGSRLATNRVTRDFIENTHRLGNDQDQTLQHFMQGEHIAIDPLFDLLSEQGQTMPFDRVESLVETHIEQGKLTQQANVALGLVTAIRGTRRFPHYINFYGQPGHTGTLPMQDRQSASRAARDFTLRFENALNDKMAGDIDCVYELVDMRVVTPKATSVPAHAYVRYDIRSTDLGFLTAIPSLIHEHAEQACQIHNTTWDDQDLMIQEQDPVAMDPDIVTGLSDLADGIEGLHAYAMPSGAGHDVMVTAEHGVPGGLIFIRHNGLSHRPDEGLTVEPDQDPFDHNSDFAKAVTLNAAWFEHPPVHQRTGHFEDDFIQNYQAERLDSA